MKPQSNCKNSRWGGSNTTESPIQPTNLIIAYTIPSAVHCLSLEALARSIQEHEKQNSLFAKALEFPGLVVFIQTIHKRLHASIAFVVSICSESNKKRNLKPLPAETEEGIPVPWAHGQGETGLCCRCHAFIAAWVASARASVAPSSAYRPGKRKVKCTIETLSNGSCETGKSFTFRTCKWSFAFILCLRTLHISSNTNKTPLEPPSLES